MAYRSGYPPAATDLGICYHNGWGTNRDFKKSFAFYRDALKLGDYEAAYFIGLCYLNGEGCKVSKEKAKKMFNLAVNNGVTEARKELKFLKENAKTVLRKKWGQPLKLESII